MSMKGLIAIVATALLWGGCTLDKSGTGDVVGRGGTSGGAPGGTSGGARGGTSGTGGVSGAAGTTGTGGVSGAAGTTGTGGTTGAGGAAGIAGTSGAVGAAGTSGTAGATGVGGAAGTSGVAGTTGSAGHGGAGAAAGAGGATGGSCGASAGGASGRGGAAGTGYIACLNPTAVVIGGQDTGYVRCMGGGSILHRSRAMVCPSLLPRASGGACTAPGTTTDPCANDAACTAKPHGYCAMVPTNRLPACGCLYGCLRDADCAPGQNCECGDPIGTCRAAACATDANCPPGSLCASADLAWGGCAYSPPARGYRCQTLADTCLTNLDCTIALPACAFSTATGTRGCHEGQVLCP